MRGLRDIRTMSGRVKKATLPHEAFLRISHIEMEKARKTVESEKASQLVADIAARLREIEAEKDTLLQAVGERVEQAPPGEQGERQGGPGPKRGRSGNRAGGFKIRY